MIGKTVSHYQILDEIGQGGMGVVYKAEDTKLKRTVALKFLPPHLTLDQESKERFIREAQAASALDHNNICTIHEINQTEEGQLFMVMACYEGQTLKEKIKNDTLTIEDAVNIITQVAQGLSKAHEIGIIHRDIKPANIMVTNDGVTKILDFGLAKLTDRSMITKEGSTLGTVSYMSPEQIRGETADHRADIWALGVVFYEMLTGQPPFSGEYEQAIMYSILSENFKRPHTINPDIPTEMDQIIQKALQKNPEKRYQSMGELIADLSACMEGEKAESTRNKQKGFLQLRYAVYIFSVPVVFAVVFIVSSLIDTETKTYQSIAVLPLDNYSNNPEQEYFVEGMTEAIIMELSKIRVLKVISRTSVMQYKNTRKSIPEIAEELHVDAIIEGSVMLAGDQVRITTQLIDASRDEHIWAEKYDRKLKDILNLHSEVARNIANEIHISLTHSEKQSLIAKKEVNPEAYDHYLMGRFHYKNINFPKAKTEFEQAVKIDSNFALALANLSFTYGALVNFGYLTSGDVVQKAKTTAQKALNIDSTLVDALIAMGGTVGYLEGDWTKGIKYLDKAANLNPNNTLAQDVLGFAYITAGNFEKGIEAKRKFNELDPLSVKSNYSLGWAYMYARQYDKAVIQFKKTIEMDSSNLWANSYLAYTYSILNIHEKALSLVKEKDLVNLRYPAPEIAAIIFARAQLKDEAIRLMDRWEQPEFSYSKAKIYSIIGEKEKAFEAIRRAIKLFRSEAMFLQIDPEYDPIRREPQFQEILRNAGLEDKILKSL